MVHKHGLNYLFIFKVLPNKVAQSQSNMHNSRAYAVTPSGMQLIGLQEKKKIYKKFSWCPVNFKGGVYQNNFLI